MKVIDANKTLLALFTSIIRQTDKMSKKNKTRISQFKLVQVNRKTMVLFASAQILLSFREN